MDGETTVTDTVITTRRMRLLPMSEAEQRALIVRETDEELKAAYGEMLAGCLEHPGDFLWYAPWKMCPAEQSDTVMGDLCFKGPPEKGEVEIGYGISEEYSGRGYATEAVAALTAWALCQPGVSAVTAETAPDNAASQRVLKKAGFLPTGEMGEEGPRFCLKKK